VLVVDDNPGVRTMLRRLVHAWGYECAEAEDGAVALEEAMSGDIALVLADYEMPGLDGLALLHALSTGAGDARRMTIPIILITGSATDDVTDESLAAGAIAVFSKPFHPLLLRTCVDHVLSGGLGHRAGA
jgi:two-component system chemotaxis response regulator CheY